MNRIYSKLLKILLLYLFSINLVYSLLIIPDKYNPILIRNPDKSNTPVIIVKFSFDKDSKGLQFNQFISLVFPKSIKNELNFHNQEKKKYECSLSDGINTYEMAEYLSPNEDEGNWTFCQLSDPINNQIKPNIDLTLTITLIDIKISKNYLNSFGLFTSTSSDVDRIIIDQLAFLGNIAFYSDPNLYTPKILEVTKSSLMSVDGKSELSTIYPYEIFDVSLNLKCNSFLNFDDIFVTFNFNEEIVSPPITIESKDLFFDDQLIINTKALRGNLSIKSNPNDNYVILNGLNENLYPGRQFQIIIKGWKALDKLTDQYSPLEIKVYYKNSYSLISSVSASTKFFNISKMPILLEADHPDGYDIFRSGLFPMKFIFSSKYDIINPSYVLIRHNNAQSGKNRYNFVASTCDFSENSSTLIDQNFGKRSTCFPLRKDFNYPNSSDPNISFKGSGVFFLINSIKAKVNYVVTIWGSADNCGGNLLENFSSSLIQINTKTKFDFSLTIYGNIDPLENEEARFSNSIIIAESNKAEMKNVCWNTLPQLPRKNFPLEAETFSPSLIPFKESNYRNFVKVIDSLGEDCEQSTSKGYCRLSHDVNLYREFYNIKLINVINTTPSGNYFNDLSDTTNGKDKESYLYGTDKISSSSYFGLIFDLPIVKDTKLMEYIPSPTAYDASTKAGYSAHLLRSLPGRLELKLQKQWFNIGNEANNVSPGCYFSWGINENLMNTKRIMKNITSPTTDFDCLKIDKNGQHNFLTSFTFSSTSNNINCEKSVPNLDITTVSNFPGANTQVSVNHYRIVSTWNSTGPGTKEGASTAKDQNGVQNKAAENPTDFNSNFNFPLPTEFMNSKLTNTSNKLVFGLYSSCFKWKTDNKIKSLFASIDIQLNYLYTSDNTASGYKSAAPHRAIRLIKLFPEGGVFQDITSLTGSKIPANLPDNTNTSTRTMKLHYSIGENSMKVGVCLIEISGANLGKIVDKISNVLVIWIGFGVLLESDYEEINSTYPIGPMANKNIDTYGLQSGYFMNSKDNFFVHYLMKDFNQFDHENTDNIIQSFLGYNLMMYGYSGVSDNPLYRTDNSQFNDSKMFNSNRSSYLFLMGSMVIIHNISGNVTTSTSNNSLNNLLIPIYCPIDDTQSIIHRNGLPTVYMAFLSMENYNEISSVNRIYSAKVANGLNATINNASAVNSNSYKTLPFALTDLFHDKIKYINHLFTLRWAPYDISDDSSLYLYYGKFNQK
jgi:hypothetical protein